VIAFFWTVSAVSVVRLARGHTASRGLTRLMAAQWGWTGLVYHGLFFTSINPAAWLFAGGFLAHGVATFASASPSPGSYRLRGSPRSRLAAAFVVYGLLYPFVAATGGHDIPRLPLFAVPCPLTLFTTGVLLAADTRPSRWLFVIPIAWSLVGGSAAVLLGVIPDLALFAAAAALVAYAVLPAGEPRVTTPTPRPVRRTAASGSAAPRP
jgi:hypothetical protein